MPLTLSESYFLWRPAAHRPCACGCGRLELYRWSTETNCVARPGHVMSQSWHRCRRDIMSQGEGSSLHLPGLPLQFQSRESAEKNSSCRKTHEAKGGVRFPSAVGAPPVHVSTSGRVSLSSRQLSGPPGFAALPPEQKHIVVHCAAQRSLTSFSLLLSSPLSLCPLPLSHLLAVATCLPRHRLRRSPPPSAASCRRLQCLWLLRLLPRWCS